MTDYLEPELVIGKSIFTYQCTRCKNIPEDVEVDDWSLMPSWSCKREGCCGELMIIKERRKGKRGRWHTKRNPFMPERIEKPVPILVFTEDDFNRLLSKFGSRTGISVPIPIELRGDRLRDTVNLITHALEDKLGKELHVSEATQAWVIT